MIRPFCKLLASRLLCSLVLIGAASGLAQEQSADQSAPQLQAANKAAQPGQTGDDDPLELPERLLDRAPFDRVTLDATNGSTVLETVLLELPARRVPDNLPQEGELSFHRLSQPSIPYAVPWAAIAKIELYEQMLLDEAIRLTTAGDFAQAFEYLAFLRTNYPDLPPLEQALQNYLWREASTTFAGGNRDQAWPALIALYARNPEYPRLSNAIQAVSDALIAERLKERNYAAARAVVDAVERDFPKLQLTNASRWRQRFAADSQEQLAKARAALAAEDYTEARDAATYAAAILPAGSGADELLKEIQRTAPEVRVGVTCLGAPGTASKTPAWATARVANLLDPRLVQEVGFGAEGGLYASPFAKISTNDAGVETTLRLSPEALRLGITPDVVAHELVESARPESPDRQEDFAANLVGIRTAAGQDVIVRWRWPPVHPEAYLQVPLRRLTDSRRGAGLWFDPAKVSEKSREARYERAEPKGSKGDKPRFVVERVYDDDEAALAALQAGEVDAVDRVPPWQLERFKGAPGVVVAPYRLPTVHVLVPNLKNPLLEMRDFRRALCYGIDREGIIRDIFLAGAAEPGYRTLSGPFPAGVGLNDPVGYGYNADLAVRPYDPRLAALLANVARSTLAKREAEARKAAAAASKPANSEDGQPSDADAKKAEAAAAAAESKPGPPAPLTLAHAADPLARLACQSIKLQLDLIGIPIKLVELPALKPEAEIPYDLLYVELLVGEPLFDARRLVGARGVAGHASALMDSALDQLDRAANLREAQGPLKEIHRIAHYDLPFLPLWQTVNYFAHRQQLGGVGESPLTLYQNVAVWQKSVE